MEVFTLKSTNSTPSWFGDDFQSNAAIMLMLKNIERATKVKVEGQTEDIEITFSDGKKVVVVLDSDNYRSTSYVGNGH